jgi:hypothetical protein
MKLKLLVSRTLGKGNQSALFGRPRCFLLEGPQWTVREAENGREALKCIEESKPDVILLDLMMLRVKGDKGDGYVIDGTGRKISLPRGSSDAALGPYHVERSQLFVPGRSEKSPTNIPATYRSHSRRYWLAGSERQLSKHAAWARAAGITCIPVAWPDFWSTVAKELGPQVRQSGVVTAWFHVLTVAIAELCRGSPGEDLQAVAQTIPELKFAVEQTI